MEQIVDIPAPLGLPDFLPGQGSTASSSSRLHDDADEGIQGGFSHFSPVPKKCGGYPSVESESARHELADEPGGALDAALAELQRWRGGG